MANITFPYLIVMDSGVLTGDENFTLQYTTPSNWELDIISTVMDQTAAWVIQNMRLSSGQNLSSATPSDPLPGTFFPDVADQTNDPFKWAVPLHIMPKESLTIDCLETGGGANRIKIVHNCIVVAKGS